MYEFLKELYFQGTVLNRAITVWGKSGSGLLEFPKCGDSGHAGQNEKQKSCREA